ncbi:MAG: transposase [Alcaligenaceae bacterium]|nr:transposase [Alcaligenaceae bacterium]
MSSLHLNPEQLQAICDQMVKSSNGINTLLSVTLNSFMKAERDLFLQERNEKSNKANGYRALRGLGIGNALALSIPRDRLGLFKPLLLHIMKEQSETLKFI